MLLDLALYAIIITPIVVFIAMMWLRAGDLVAGKIMIVIGMMMTLAITIYFIEWSVKDPSSMTYKVLFAAMVVATFLLGIGANKYNRRKYGMQPTSVYSKQEDEG